MEQKPFLLGIVTVIAALILLAAAVLHMERKNAPVVLSPGPSATPAVATPQPETAPAHPQDVTTANSIFGPASRPTNATDAVITPDLQNAIDKGLKALAAAQCPDGGYRMSTLHVDQPEQLGVTALAGMAFLAAGDTPTRGTYAANLKLIHNAIAQRPDGVLVLAKDSGGMMYHHAFAMEFIANLALRSEDAATREKCTAMLKKAAALTVSAQGESGGWRYAPKPADADSSCTAAQLVSLRSAVEAGFVMDKSVAQHAAEYLIANQVDDGGFGYTDNKSSAFARSCAAEAALYHAGLAKSEAATSGLSYLRGFFPKQAGDTANFLGAGYPYYGLFYATQIMYLQGGDWKDWYAATAAEVVKHQADTGLWTDSSGDIVATAEALIMLQYPQKNLPAWLHEK